MNLNYSEALKELIRSRLQSFEPIKLDRSHSRHAAVAFTLMNCSEPADIANIQFVPDNKNMAAFLLTTRAKGLSSHGGQRAYPGGRVDPGESALQAAVRELREEVGLAVDDSAILGRLDDYPTRSGYIISPFVIWAGSDPVLIAGPDEVAAMHRIPLNELIREDAPILQVIPESDQPVLKMPIGDDWFAAPSAAIAYQFREIALYARPTRVAHFEQPYFAWK
ncbi:MAG: 8-oxo-dGTP pyrophosphatase MutT (NUDIX family) [Gammaproteobacteria bacterium]|jgi:8-oxo-dGTP pyrophosphatase MutT (NUDIX family)